MPLGWSHLKFRRLHAARNWRRRGRKIPRVMLLVQMRRSSAMLRSRNIHFARVSDNCSQNTLTNSEALHLCQTTVSYFPTALIMYLENIRPASFEFCLLHNADSIFVILKGLILYFLTIRIFQTNDEMSFG